MRKATHRLLLGLIAIILVTAAACQGQEKEPAASPAPAPQQPIKDATGNPNDLQIPKPGGDLSIKVGFPSSISLYDVPTAMTNERLNQQGWKIENVEFARTNLQAQAFAQGSIQVGVAQFLDPLRNAQRGGKVAWLMENNGGEYVIIAKNEIQDCKAIDGKRFAIHDETATGSIVTKNWLLNDCHVKPTFLVVPGGENRVVALRNGQIDATFVQLSDWMNLNAQAPGKFHIVDTGTLYNNLSGGGYFANTEWLAKSQDVAAAYLAETLKTFRMIHADPSLLEAAVQKYLPDTPKEAISPAVKAYFDIAHSWPQNGGDTSMLSDAITYFTQQGELQPGMQASAITNTTAFTGALGLVGKVPNQR